MISEKVVVKSELPLQELRASVLVRLNQAIGSRLTLRLARPSIAESLISFIPEPRASVSSPSLSIDLSIVSYPQGVLVVQSVLSGSCGQSGSAVILGLSNVGMTDIICMRGKPHSSSNSPSKRFHSHHHSPPLSLSLSASPQFPCSLSPPFGE